MMLSKSAQFNASNTRWFNREEAKTIYAGLGNEIDSITDKL
ncbi:13306_t:CDS:2 [Funneliformis caledonium]|uniref:13306_t:CDS:1 n=1 Tax=Funneliformis caledonium TaxID=1117310 RepID=A0A9N8WE61_9GLOM|nr:13306_t:CDS:2 [Funneliformis caledonium]